MTQDMWGVNVSLSDFDKLLSADDLEEEPVPLEVFFHDNHYLGLKHDISDVQMEIARRMTQILKPSTLVQIHGEDKGMEIYNKYTVSEIVAQIGKGGGKDFISRASFCYIIYQLHCLRDPLDYYKKAHGTYIDLLNLAVNAQQAQRVFFDPFKNLLLASPYFNEVGFDPRVNEVFFFSRPVRCFSGHSESEGWEGYDLLTVVLDEISAFKTASELTDGSRMKGTAEAVYQMAKPSVMSRFPDVGKCISEDSLIWVGGLKRAGDVFGTTGLTLAKEGEFEINGWYDDGISEGLKITDSHGSHLDVTPEHKLYVRSDDGYEGYKEAKYITKSDWLAHRPGAIWGNSDINERESYTLGLWVAEGSSYAIDTKYNQSIIVLGAERFLMDLVVDQMSEWRERFARKSIHNNRKPVSVKDRDEAFSFVKIKGVGLEESWKNHYGIRSLSALNKHVPDLVMESSELCVRSFLRGLFDGDGYTSKRVELGTASEQLRDEVSALMWGLGIENTLREKDTASGNKSYIIRINDTVLFNELIGFSNPSSKKSQNLNRLIANHKGVHRYLPGAKEHLVEMCDKYFDKQPGGRRACGVSRIGRNISGDRELTKAQAIKYLEGCQDESVNVNLLRLVNDNIIWSRVVDVSPSTARRIDFEVNEVHNYVANSIVSHNCILLSFPRFKGDFIQQRMASYEEGEDEKIWGITATTWESNPTITRESLEPEFRRNPVQANLRFACIPPEMTDAYFREPDRVRLAFIQNDSPLNEDGTYKPWFNGSDGHPRFIHIDLAQKKDHAALCMAHSSGMKEIKTMAGVEVLPIVHMDFLRYWKAAEGQEIPFDDIRNQILELNRLFDVAVVSFDEWNSVDMAQTLRSKGMNVDKLTIRKGQYDTLSTTIYDRRLMGYWDQFLVEEELLKLRLIKNIRVDHGSGGFKDGSDALAGAVYQCLKHVDIGTESEIEIITDDYDSWKVLEKVSSEPVKPEIPADLQEWLMEVL